MKGKKRRKKEKDIHVYTVLGYDQSSGDKKISSKKGVTERKKNMYLAKGWVGNVAKEVT